MNAAQFAATIQADDWIKMITVNPAQALGLDEKIGKLAPGLKADITVLRAAADERHQSLLHSHPQDVQMVWIGGDLLTDGHPWCSR